MLPITVVKSKIFQGSLKKFCNYEEIVIIYAKLGKFNTKVFIGILLFLDILTRCFINYLLKA